MINKYNIEINEKIYNGYNILEIIAVFRKNPFDDIEKNDISAILYNANGYEERKNLL
jgi:hypothetical protein